MAAPTIPPGANAYGWAHPLTVGNLRWGNGDAAAAPVPPACMRYALPTRFVSQLPLAGSSLNLGQRFVHGPAFDRIDLLPSQGSPLRTAPVTVPMIFPRWIAGAWDISSTANVPLRWNRPVGMVPPAGGKSLLGGHPLGDPRGWSAFCPFLPVQFTIPADGFAFTDPAGVVHPAPADVAVTNPLVWWAPEVKESAPVLLAAQAYGSTGYFIYGPYGGPYAVYAGYKSLEYDIWLWFDQPIRVNPAWVKAPGGTLAQPYTRSAGVGAAAFFATDWEADPRFNCIRVRIQAPPEIAGLPYYWMTATGAAPPFTITQMAVDLTLNPDWLLGANGLPVTGTVAVTWGESPVRFVPVACPTKAEGKRATPGRTAALEWGGTTDAPSPALPFFTADYDAACSVPLGDPVPYGTAEIPRHFPHPANLGTQCPASHLTHRLVACRVEDLGDITVTTQDPDIVQTAHCMVLSCPALPAEWGIAPPGQEVGDLDRQAFIPRTGQYVNIGANFPAPLYFSSVPIRGIWKNNTDFPRLYLADAGTNRYGWTGYPVASVLQGEPLSSFDIVVGDIVLVWMRTKAVRTPTGDFPLVNFRAWPYEKFIPDRAYPRAFVKADSDGFYDAHSDAAGSFAVGGTTMGALPDVGVTLSIAYELKAAVGPVGQGTVIATLTGTLSLVPSFRPMGVTYYPTVPDVWQSGYPYANGTEVWDGTDIYHTYISYFDDNTAPLSDAGSWGKQDVFDWYADYAVANIPLTGLPDRPAWWTSSITYTPNAYVGEGATTTWALAPTVLRPFRAFATVTGKEGKAWAGQLPPDNGHVTGL